MDKVQENPATKAATVLTMLISAFLCGLFAAQAMLLLPLVGMTSWQYTPPFTALLEERERDVAALFATRMEAENDQLSELERRQTADLARQKEKELAADATCFRFQVLSSDGSAMLFSNLSDGESLEQAVDSIHYASFLPGEHTISQSIDTYEDYSVFTIITDEEGSQPEVNQQSPLIIECGVALDPGEGAPEDEFTFLLTSYQTAQSRFYPYAALAAVMAGICLCALLVHLWCAGHKAGHEEIVLSWQDKSFFELYFILLSGGFALVLSGLFTMADSYIVGLFPYSSQDPTYWAVSFACALLCTALVGVCALLLRTILVRLKARCFIRTTLIGLFLTAVFRSARGFFVSLPLTWRTAGFFLLYLLVHLLSPALFGYYAPVILALLNLGVLLALCRWTLYLRRLRQGSQAIAAGNLSHQINTDHMPHDLRQLGEDLNNISVGLSGAVEEKMKSERFKAELITNVSHDLKTPLTSIINYVNLLKTTQQTDPTAQQYIEVLDRKSQRLKKLTEDLVEASKASTGVLSVNREKIGMGQLIDQALGEWEEKLAERNLTVVPSIPEGETWVYADGRHLWRVIDNLLSNCAKYAMEGTRVYLDLTRGRGSVSLSVKNISREALNIPPERLMERFVRGDESRTTEGSGLGLSIARSLTELQGGTFELAVDGDLFKATVTLPQAN